MNLANKLTVLRIIMIIPFVIFLLLSYKIAALIIFIIASLTDYIDGKIARHRNEVSNLGKFLDPLADKLFISSAFIIFVQLDELSVKAWPVILIIAREFTINGLRMFALSKGKIIAATYTGKFKTTFQFAAIFLILLMFITGKFRYMAQYIVVLTAVITVYSGFVYLIENKELFKEDI